MPPCLDGSKPVQVACPASTLFSLALTLSLRVDSPPSILLPNTQVQTSTQMHTSHTHLKLLGGFCAHLVQPELCSQHPLLCLLPSSCSLSLTHFHTRSLSDCQCHYNCCSASLPACVPACLPLSFSPLEALLQRIQTTPSCSRLTHLTGQS